jgi:lipopolysaccharide/colanic/teichoic acid biosynthesis glycosyltransferase
MRDTPDADSSPLSNKLRVTPLGRFLRRASLDELPELVNVLRGEMSLVGPRPLRVEYLERYTPEQARRHSVLPGITGWAQIKARNRLTWGERLALDIWYVDHASTWLDLKILMQTVF